MTRYRAAAYHFLISLCIFVALASIFFFAWFPGFFYQIDGGWEGLRIVVAVDLVLGPMLTLVVFKSGKPGLKFDLTLIGLLQASCLAAGVSVVYSERPIFFVYYEKHFYSVSSDNYTEHGVLPPDPGKFGGAPAMVFVDLPVNPIEEADLRKIYFQDRVPLWTNSRLYEPLSQHIQTVLADGVAESAIRERDGSGSLDDWIATHGGSFDDYAFLPVRSRYRSGYVGIRRDDGEFGGFLEIKPARANTTLAK